MKKEKQIFERDNWTCQLCGVKTPPESRGIVHPCAPEVDHIVPKCRGGGNESENLRCLCRSCNQNKLGFLDGELKAVISLSDFELPDVVAIMAATDAMREGSRKGAPIGGRAMAAWVKQHPEKASENGRRIHRLYPRLAAENARRLSYETRSRGGKLAHDAKHRADPKYHEGKVRAGSASVANGHPAKANCGRTGSHENKVRAGRLGGLAGGSNGGIKTNHNRWHIARGISSVSCALCRKVQ